jgi:EAL domain-containing protein (putative c-di-GMP-specific phosphodiesterase class I)/CheY-like chemotaxis protein
MTSAIEVTPHTVLVVEDHPFQRRLLARLLTALGVVRVIEAEDGAQALELLDAATEPIDLVITDLDMPNVDGMALMRQIGERAPQADIVVLSSVDRDLLSAVQWLAREQRIALLAVLEKPLTAPALRAALRRPACSARLARPPPLPVLSVGEIAAGIAAGQFESFLQPKVLLSNGRLAGGEALARWRHPTLGWVPPAAFIDTIEHSPLVEPFSLAIVESAAWAVRWLHESGLPGHIAINASPAWLDQPSMADRLSQAVSRLGLPVERVAIEVTESVANSNLAAALENLARLRLRGFTLSVDDFGTGFSSLGRLVSSPFRELKFDRSFITGIEPGTPRWMVVEAVIALAHKLGLQTVAEGIETQAEWQLLKNAGCEYAQGYFIAKPMARDDFLVWAHSRRAGERAAAAAIELSRA